MNNNKNDQDFLKKAKDFLGWKLLAPLFFFGGFLLILGPMKDDAHQLGWSGYIYFMEAGFYITLALILWKLFRLIMQATHLLLAMSRIKAVETTNKDPG